MPSLVCQLQEAALDPAKKPTEILARVKVAAVKLGLGEVADWVRHELNGYEKAPVPPYRQLQGKAEALNPLRGPIPLFFKGRDGTTDRSVVDVRQALGEIESLLETGQAAFQMPFGSRLQDEANKGLPIPMPAYWSISASHLTGILDGVRRRALDWSLSLDQAGVLGEGMTFSQKEKAAAMTVTNNFHNANIGVLGDVSGAASVSISQQVDVRTITASEIHDLLGQVSPALDHLPTGLRAQVEPPIKALEAEAAKPQADQSVVRTALQSLRTVCEGASGNLIAAGVLALVKPMLGA